MKLGSLMGHTCRCIQYCILYTQNSDLVKNILLFFVFHTIYSSSVYKFYHYISNIDDTFFFLQTLEGRLYQLIS